MPAQRPADEDFQPVEVDRLGDEIVRAALHGLDRGVDRAVGRHHDAHGRAGHLEGAVDEFHAVVGAEAQIGQQQIDAFGFQDADRPGEIGGGVDFEIVVSSDARRPSRVCFSSSTMRMVLFFTAGSGGCEEDTQERGEEKAEGRRQKVEGGGQPQAGEPTRR